jgi:hypothetical protein
MSKSIPNVDWANQLESVIRLVSFVEENRPPINSNSFQRYPTYLTLHKILDGTEYFVAYF